MLYYKNSNQLLPDEAVPYFSVREEISVQVSNIFTGNRAIIPETLCLDVMKRYSLHTLELRAVCKERKNVSTLPGMNTQIKT